MPIYEYECQSCRHRLEKLQRLSDEPLTDCPDCGESALKRLISAAGFRLKGSGWYETDFKKDNRRNVAGESDGASTGSGGESGKSESKSQDSGKSSPDSKKGSKKESKSKSEQAA